MSYGTGLYNHNRIVFEEMSSWTDLTMDLGIKITIYIKYIKSKYDFYDNNMSLLYNHYSYHYIKCILILE